MKEKYLPLGTVVLLKGAKRNVMITSYLVFSGKDNSNKKLYDYGACPFPEGLLRNDLAIGFNHDDIAEIVYIGLENEEQRNFNQTLISKTDELKKQYEESLK
jgi:hypothetical protein